VTPQTRIWCDSSGSWSWQAGAVFGYADTREEAERLAAKADKPTPKPAPKKRKPRNQRREALSNAKDK
jgi:hypothetical protein